ncbi:MAG: radical SAM protein [Spirochaetes bacterium]|nr:radical SAM protein [Spirochaetota bacterium]
MSQCFETGPIRPPSEASSLLLRLTRNCPWNKCAFCHIYKKYQFSRRSIEEIKSDIDAIMKIAEDLVNTSQKLGYNGTINRETILQAANEHMDMQDEYYRTGMWISGGAGTVFLQDANSLLMKTDEIVDVLNYLTERFPSIQRITTYARSKTISKKSLEELKDLRKAGLSRIHVGMESGSDKVLKLIMKGVTGAEHISAGRKAIEAGFDLSEYFMPGLGGKELTEEHALESARVLNEINPTFIRIRTTVPVPGTPLHQMMLDKIWTPLTDEGKVIELKTMIEKFEGITSKFVSDHILNLLEDLEGKLPEAKDKMLKIIDKFLNMDTIDKENFIIGRRIGVYRYFSEYKQDKRVEEARKQILQNFSSIDDAVMQISLNYL